MQAFTSKDGIEYLDIEKANDRRAAVFNTGRHCFDTNVLYVFFDCHVWNPVSCERK